MESSKGENVYNFFYTLLLSNRVKRNGEVVIISVAVISFIVHLLLILLSDSGVIHLNDSSDIFSNPVAAIYTPFSFILIYEVYLLVYYLPKSTTFYIGKQYEIITLILIRSIFKDLSKLKFSSDWFRIQNDLQFTIDLAATLVLFFLIYLFYRLNERKFKTMAPVEELPHALRRFIRMKNIMAMLLIPVFLALACYGLYSWIWSSFYMDEGLSSAARNLNIIFFDEFFTILILADVLLLLISFLHTDKFNQVIRNSGFIISTILIKLSFSIEGLLNTVLILVAVLFGVILLAVNNQYEKITLPEND